MSRKKWVMKLIFCMPIYIKVFCKLMLSFLMGLARHAQSTHTGLHFLCNISRVKLGMKFIFLHDGKHQNWSFLTGVARHAQNTQNKKFLEMSVYVLRNVLRKYLRNVMLDCLDQSIQKNTSTISQERNHDF